MAFGVILWLLHGFNDLHHNLDRLVLRDVEKLRICNAIVLESFLRRGLRSMAIGNMMLVNDNELRWNTGWLREFSSALLGGVLCLADLVIVRAICRVLEEVDMARFHGNIYLRP
jgi:hypothetical protein